VPITMPTKMTELRVMPAIAAGERTFWGSMRWSWFSGFESVGETVVESVELDIKVGPDELGDGCSEVVGTTIFVENEVGLAGGAIEERSVSIGTIGTIDGRITVRCEVAVDVGILEGDTAGAIGAGLFPVFPN
jgi:hypothetical protein